MPQPRPPVLALAVLVALARGAGASCVQGELPRVATIEVESCEEAADFLREREREAGGADPDARGAALLAREPGVVVTGRVTRKIHVTQHGAEDFHVEDVVGADESVTWFVAPARPEAGAALCDAYAAGSTVEVYAAEPCCDTIPASEPACVLHLAAAARPVPAALAEIVAAHLRAAPRPD